MLTAHSWTAGRKTITKSELSMGFPLPDLIPYAHRKVAQVTETPIKAASTFPISGKVVILHRKYSADEMIEPDTIKSPIWYGH
jgi:hypothetical protein